jgi:hypothetical protein
LFSSKFYYGLNLLLISLDVEFQGDDPNLCINISFSWVEISLHVESHLLGLPSSGRFMVGDKKTTENRQQKSLSIYLMAPLASSSS